MSSPGLRIGEGDGVGQPGRTGPDDTPGRVSLCCYLSSEEFGGMERILASLLEFLPPRFDVTLMGNSAEVLAELVRSRPVTDVVLMPMIRGKWDVVAIAAHVAALRRLRPDLLHASLGHLYQAQYTLFAAVVTGTPAVAVVHGVFPRTPRRSDGLLRWVMHRVRVAGVSNYVCQSIESEFRLPSGTADLLHNAVMDEVATSPPAVPDPDGRVVLGAVGRCAPEKGFDVLLRSLVAVPDCRLVILGDGEALTELIRLARRLGVDDRVQFAGWVEPPWTSSWHFDILVAPSRAEGFGMAVVEAMQVGIPVLASGVGGLAELIDNGSTGILVPPEDPAALAAAITALAGEPEERRAMAERARAVVAGRFGTQPMVRAYVDLFDDVLGRKARP